MFKKFSSLIIACTFAAFSIFDCYAYSKTVVEKTDTPPKMVFLGDSIAAGFGLEGYSPDDLYSCRSYANILADKYKTELQGKCSAHMENKAVSGETSADLLQHLKNGEFDNTLENSDAVVISIGGNDVLALIQDALDANLIYDSDSTGEIANKFDISKKGVLKLLRDLVKISLRLDNTINKFGKNINEITTYIHSKTDGEIIFQTVYNPLNGTGMFDSVVDYVGEKIDALNSVINDKSSEDKYTVCDIAQSFDNKGLELTNIADLDIHPNAKGHEVIAEDLDKVIKSKTYTYERSVEIPDETSQTDSTKDNDKYFIAVIIFIGAGAAVIVLFMICKKNKKG